MSNSTQLKVHSVCLMLLVRGKSRMVIHLVKKNCRVDITYMMLCSCVKHQDRLPNHTFCAKQIIIVSLTAVEIGPLFGIILTTFLSYYNVT